MTRKRIVCVFIFIFLLYPVFVQTSFTLPRFALDTGASCQSCHLNPTGGGMRNSFGAEYYGRIILPIRTFEEENRLEGFTTNLNDFIRIGADFRMIGLYRDDGPSTTFFQMQGDIYLSLQATQNLYLYLDKGLYGGFEIFGLWHLPSIKSFVKAGKFVPAYGIRMDDHNIYTRSGGVSFGAPIPGLIPLPFAERAEDTGIEFGYDGRKMTTTIGFFNGNPGAGYRFADTDINAISLRSEWRFLQSNSYNALIGGSFYRNKRSAFENINFSVFGGFGIHRTFNILTEILFASWKEPPAASADNFIFFFTELNFLLQKGVDLKLQYNMGTGGSPEITRHAIGLGSEIFILAGFELRPLYRLHFSDELPNFSEMIIMFHFYF